MYIKNRTDEGIHRAAFGLISPNAVVFAARTVLLIGENRRPSGSWPLVQSREKDK
jgi:hypothetical protein